ncbi:Galactose mutarotase [Pseudooceanicola antarcticus]|uniref:Aldose epimerase n=1 Tax=Pseudooceanicola antarcticus TaxID=1247613 RepID=A0A285HPP9_9RHOB|nr:aldose 1-epimerase family protein [Pseudooceanicola antarcticus]PJE27692.1 aldose epimerase [Pseudooceanicola antarcticus]SNY37730.1 Galactose mutarotase [Pseudooceanicola antarcticus]
MASDITLSNDQLTATVSDLGAELQSLTHESGELLWHGDAAHWSGRSPILFPIVGRAPGDVIAVDGQEAPMRQHGFARKMAWELAEHTATSCTHVLRDTAETRAIYPRAFQLSLTHALSGATLTATAEVRNTGDQPLPFGLGFHPAFNWPLPGAGDAPHRITLDNGAEPPCSAIDGDSLLAPEMLPSPFTAGELTLAHALFENDALVFLEGAGDALTYAAPGTDAPALHFRFENLPALGIWTKPQGAPFICVEPWHGVAARQGAGPEIAERPLSMELAPGETARFAWSVSVS